MNSNNPEENQGALERMKISVQTTPPEQVLTAGKAKSIRFRVSRPHGYSYGDVESYQFDYVIPTLEWYSETLHQRDMTIHMLGELVDKLEVDLLNTKAQLDAVEINSALKDGVADTETDAEFDALQASYDNLQDQLALTQAALKEAQQSAANNSEGEESYSLEDVHNYINSAVAEADKAKDDYYAQLLVHKENEFVVLLEEERNKTQGAAQAVPEGYTEEEVHAAIDAAVAETEREKDSQYTLVLEAHTAALEEETAAKVEAFKTSLAEAEARAANAEALIAKAQAVASEAETRAANAEALVSEAQNMVPAGASSEELEEAVAENKRLGTEYAKLLVYAKQLEEYNKVLEASGAETPIATKYEATNNGRPKPKLRPEDL